MSEQLFFESSLTKTDPAVLEAVKSEFHRQNDQIELIASEKIDSIFLNFGFLQKTHELPEKFRKFINLDTKGYYFVVVGRSRDEPSPFCLNWGEDVPKFSGNFHRSN